MGIFANAFTWWNGASWGTSIFSRRHGKEVGRDEAGNVYFEHRKTPSRRWVIYTGNNDSSRVPPGWNAWLRGTISELPDKALPRAPRVRAAAAAQRHRDAVGLSPGGIAERERGARRGDRRLPGMEARVSVSRRLVLLALVALGAGCDRFARDDDGQPVNGANAVTVDVPRAVEPVAGVTPMASGSRCSACSTSATASSATSR